jgi:hypothetical protein
MDYDPNLGELIFLWIDWPLERFYQCAHCGNEIIPEDEEDARCWDYDGEDDIIWVCSQCNVPEDRCVKCGVWRTSKEDTPLCASCLKAYFANLLDAYRQNSKCRNCRASIRLKEFNRYVDGDFLCDHCRDSNLVIEEPVPAVETVGSMFMLKGTTLGGRELTLVQCKRHKRGQQSR